MVANLLCARWSKKLVFRRFLWSHSVDFSASSKINYFRSRRVRWCIREVQEHLFRASIFASKCLPNRQNFGIVVVKLSEIKFWRPCRGLSAGKALRPQEGISQMTRRAFLSFKSNSCAGEIVIKRGCESFGRKVVRKVSFSKISREPFGRF